MARTARPAEPTSRRERGKKRRRDAIKRAAFALFVEKGFERTTVDEITRRADVAKGTFFSFFPSKRAVLVDYYQALDAHFFEAIDALDPDRPEEALLGYYRRAERLLRSEDRLAHVLIQAIAVEPDLGLMDRESGHAVERRVAAFLAESRKRGTMRKDAEPDLAARVLSDIWSPTVREWFEQDGAFSLSQRLGAKIRLLFGGLAPVRAPARTPARMPALRSLARPRQPAKRGPYTPNKKERTRDAKEHVLDAGLPARDFRSRPPRSSRRV